MMSLVVVAGAVMQLPAGRLSDMTDRRYVLAGAALGRRRLRRADLPRRRRAPAPSSSRMTARLRRARLHALFDRRGACQRPRQAGGFRQGVGRPAAALRLRHDDRPGDRRRADGLDAARRACSWRRRCRISCSPPTRCCASAAARRCRRGAARRSRRCRPIAARRRRRCGSIRAQPKQQHG